MAAGNAHKISKVTSTGRWARTSRKALLAKVTNAAGSFNGRRWPKGVTRAVQVNGRLYPARSIAIAATGEDQMKNSEVELLFSKVGMPISDVREVGRPEYAGTVDPMLNEQVIKTSDTPPPDVLASFLGEWVAMSDGAIIDHDKHLTALVGRLNEAGVENDRLFRVPDDISAPTPATLG